MTLRSAGRIGAVTAPSGFAVSRSNPILRGVRGASPQDPRAPAADIQAGHHVGSRTELVVTLTGMFVFLGCTQLPEDSFVYHKNLYLL